MPTTYVPGDILLVSDYSGPVDWLGGLIRDGERARGDGADAVWTHSALIVSTDGDLIEAMASGVQRGHVSEYAHVQTEVLSLGIPADDPRRAFAVRFAEAQLGHPYGVLDFLSLAFSVLFGNRWSTHTDGQMICSELCARCVESATDHGFPYAPERMMPSDLARGLAGVPPIKPLSFLARVRLLIATTAKAAVGLL